MTPGAEPLTGLTIDEWFVVFHEKSGYPGLEWLCPGRFKHVSAFGYAGHARVWVRVEWTGRRVEIEVAPRENEQRALVEWSSHGPVLRCLARWTKKRTLGRWGLWCVPLTAHLVGVDTCALRPDRLWNVLLANGAVRVDEGSPDEEAEGRSGNPAPAEGRA